jgi:DNA-binding TFAR19-related protein (PDSD5 family)
MGDAVENMMRIDKSYGQTITNTQSLLGRGYMTVDNLSKMMQATSIRKSITGEQVKNILEMPDSYNSAKMAKELGTELIEIAQKGYDEYEKSRQMDMQKVNEPENQQQLDTVQLVQPV